MEWGLISSSSQGNFPSFPWLPSAWGSFTCATRSTRIQHAFVPHLSDWAFSLVDWLENKVDCWTPDELELNLGLLLCITLAHDCRGENPSATLPLEWSYKTTSQLGSFSDKHIIKVKTSSSFFFKGQQFQLYNNFFKCDMTFQARQLRSWQDKAFELQSHAMGWTSRTPLVC